MCGAEIYGMSGAAARTGKFKINVIIKNTGRKIVELLEKTQQINLSRNEDK